MKHNKDVMYNIFLKKRLETNKEKMTKREKNKIIHEQKLLTKEVMCVCFLCSTVAEVMKIKTTQES